MGKKLWILRPVAAMTVTGVSREVSPWVPWYDRCFGMVVAAETEDDARVIASHGGGRETREGIGNPWLSSMFSECTELVADDCAGVVLTDIREA